MSEFPPLRGDEDELIRAFTPVLERRLAYLVNTSAANREDAIAFAWTVFLRRQPDRDGPWRSYLSTIARNEAIALDRRDRDHGTLTRVSDRDHPVPADTGRAHPERQVADPHDPHAQRLELSDAVALLAQLPEGPRQIAFLRAHGLRWRELQELTGLTRSQLNRRLVRANRALEQLLDQRREAERPLPPRVARLRALEQDPPGWLTDELGRPPTGRHARAEALREWRRAAVAIDRYRDRFGITDATSALGERPADPTAGRAHDDARRQIERARHARHHRQARTRALTPNPMPMHSHHLISYHGRPAALVAPERVHVLARWLTDAPAGDPDARFVLFMCVFARLVQLGRLPCAFSTAHAERWARRALIDDDELIAHPHRPARDHARRAGVPTKQVTTRRRELNLPDPP